MVNASMVNKNFNTRFDHNRYNKENDIIYYHLVSIINNQVKSDILNKYPEITSTDLSKVPINCECIYIKGAKESYDRIILQI